MPSLTELTTQLGKLDLYDPLVLPLLKQQFDLLNFKYLIFEIVTKKEKI